MNTAVHDLVLPASQRMRSHDPCVPLRWLLTSRGVRLPDDQQARMAL
jgi:hypothetical protein